MLQVDRCRLGPAWICIRHSDAWPTSVVRALKERAIGEWLGNGQNYLAWEMKRGMTGSSSLLVFLCFFGLAIRRRDEDLL